MIPKANYSPLEPGQVNRIRWDFPILQRQINGHPLIYLDNASTTQKPGSVIDAERSFYREFNANVHRGVHRLSQEATLAYEEVRKKAHRFLGSERPDEIILTRGATDGLNLAAHCLARTVIGPGEEVLVSDMDHHSNCIPWVVACRERGATLRSVPVLSDGQLDLEKLDAMLSTRTKVVALPHVSNVLGTVNPVTDISKRVHGVGAVLVIDGAQAPAHIPIDVQALGCDCYACSGHKMLGPTGTGLLYVRRSLVAGWPPYQCGGEMAVRVGLDRVEYAEAPGRFEAGTPNIAGIIGLGAAIDYLNGLDREGAGAYEEQLRTAAIEALMAVPGIRLGPTPPHAVPILTFTMDGIHPHDICQILDDQGIALRAGNHCAEPLHRALGLDATVRASFLFYNTIEEVEAFARAFSKVREVFAL